MGRGAAFLQNVNGGLQSTDNNGDVGALPKGEDWTVFLCPLFEFAMWAMEGGDEEGGWEMGRERGRTKLLG